MCLFTTPIESVSSTRIFARLEEDRQAIIYDMFLLTQRETAMVLPIPISLLETKKPVEFVDLSGYESIFNDIDNLFPKPKATRSAPVSASLDLLDVIQVGVYDASFVPTPQDFERLDPRFRLNTLFFDSMPQYNDYGFVVFQLKPGASQVHPLAFWFATRNRERLFFPTIHMHDGEVKKTATYHHTLYMQSESVYTSGLRRTHDAINTPALRSIAVQSQNLVSDQQEFSKLFFQGYMKNEDIWIG